VRRRVEREQAGPAICVDAVASGRRDRNLGPQVAEADLAAGMADRSHRGDAGAIAGRRHYRAVVAGRDHHQHLESGQLPDHIEVGLFTNVVATQTHVQDARRSRIVRHAVDVQTRGPAHAGEDVAVDAAAFAEHAYWQDLRTPAEAGDAGAVVGQCGDHSGDAGAVPRAVAYAAVGESRVRLVTAADPVAGIGSIGIAAVAVVGLGRAADEIETGQQFSARGG